MKLHAALLLSLGLAACSGWNDSLEVNQFQLRDQKRDFGEEPMVRMEKQRRLYGAVSMEERRQRLGQYYSLSWNESKFVGSGPVEVVFEYRQGGTASEVKRMSKSFPASAVTGTAEFTVTGDDYFDHGKVLAWRASLHRAGKEIAVRRSYLWK